MTYRSLDYDLVGELFGDDVHVSSVHNDAGIIIWHNINTRKVWLICKQLQIYGIIIIIILVSSLFNVLLTLVNYK